jgi:glycine cleavage system aminomethyltransferase T
MGDLCGGRAAVAHAAAACVFADVDLSNEALPLHGGRGIPVERIGPRDYLRLSFSGELAFEVSVPAWRGEDLVRTLFDCGRAFDAVPYGTEALGVMRIEKGHAAGNEINGQTTAGDLGMARMMSKKKDFIGRIMASRPGLAASVIGRRSSASSQRIDAVRLRAGAHLLAPGAALVAANDEGYVTSAAFSPTLGHSVALALLARGPERHGEQVVVYDPVRGGRRAGDRVRSRLLRSAGSAPSWLTA